MAPEVSMRHVCQELVISASDHSYYCGYTYYAAAIGLLLLSQYKIGLVVKTADNEFGRKRMQK
jgi:hypothetical protein